MNHEQFLIINDGPLIESTSFWESNLAALGKFVVNCHAGAIRMLLPDGVAEAALPEMKSAYAMIMRRGKWRVHNPLGRSMEVVDGTEVLEFLFEDGSDSPYSMHGTMDSAFGAFPTVDDQKRSDLRLLVYSSHAKFPQADLELPAYYRLVDNLPDLRTLPLVARLGRYGMGKSRWNRE